MRASHLRMWKYGYAGQKYALVFRENAPPRTARYRISYFFLVLAPQAPTQSPIDPVPGSPRAPATSRCRNTATAPNARKPFVAKFDQPDGPHIRKRIFSGVQATQPARGARQTRCRALHARWPPRNVVFGLHFTSEKPAIRHRARMQNPRLRRHDTPRARLGSRVSARRTSSRRAQR